MDAIDLPIQIIQGMEYLPRIFPVSPNMAVVFGLLACAIVLTAFSARILPWPPGCRDNPLIFSGIAILTLLPIGDHPGLASGLYGVLSAPSGTLLQLSLLSFLNRTWPAFPKRRYLWLVILLAALFYAASLGAWKTSLPDPYAWGYQPSWLILGVVVAGAGLLALRQTAWLVILSVDLLGWRCGLFPSQNLWDYLFDPALVGILIWLACRRKRQAAAIPADTPTDQSSGRS